MESSIFLAAFAWYLCAMHGSYGIPDTTEYMGASWTLGVAHPSGYSVFLMLERLLGSLSVGGPAFRLHLLGPLAGATVSALVFKIGNAIAGTPWGLLSTSLVMTSPWMVQATADLKGATYAVHLVFICLLLRQSLNLDAKAALKMFLVGGLALVHHVPLGAALFPSLAVLVCVGWIQGNVNARVMTFGAAFLLLSGSGALYLAIRSAAHPAICWGHLSDLSGWSQVLRWSVGQFRAISMRQAPPVTEGYGVMFSALLTLSVVGSWFGQLANRGKGTFFAAGMTALSCIPFVRHDVADGGIQYTLVILVSSSFGLGGLIVWLAEQSHSWAQRSRRFLMAAAVLAIAPSVWMSTSRSVSQDYLFDDYIRNVGDDLGRGRSMLVWLGDYDFDAARYRQIILGATPETSHVHLAMAQTIAYGDLFAKLKEENPWIVIPHHSPASLRPQAYELDLLGAEMAQDNMSSCRVYVEPSFLDSPTIWPRMRQLHPQGIGYLASLNTTGTTNILRRMLRGRHRGLFAQSHGGDPWYAGLRSQIRSALKVGLASSESRIGGSHDAAKVGRLVALIPE